MRILSVGTPEPSAEVDNTILPGISSVPGVPSTKQSIFPAAVKEVASLPLNSTVPIKSFSATAVLVVPSVDLALCNCNFAPLAVGFEVPEYANRLIQ